MNPEPVIQNEVSQKVKNIVYCVYMESRKMVLMNVFAGLHWRRRQIMDGAGGGGEDEMNGESTVETYTLPHVK